MKDEVQVSDASKSEEENSNANANSDVKDEAQESDANKSEEENSNVDANSAAKDETQESDASESEEENSNTNEGTGVVVTISNTMLNKNGEKEEVFTTNTEIPVIPMDLYTLSNGQAELFDINFFDTTKTNTEKFREVVQSIVLACSRALMYISAALLLTMLIWRSVILVKGTVMGNVNNVAESKRIINSWIKGAILVAVIYVIAALIIYCYSYILETITKGYNSKYLIRLNVENVYSFNTNIIGYIRYMTLSANGYASLGNSIIYLLMAILNVVWWLIMFARLIIVAVLIIIAPITAINMSRGNVIAHNAGIQNIFYFKRWLMMYILFVFLPLIAIISQILIVTLV